jgi:hypothetical protein
MAGVVKPVSLVQTVDIYGNNYWSKFRMFSTIHIKVKVFWLLMPHSVVVRYQHFRVPCYLLKLEAAWSSKTLVLYCNTMWHHNPEEIGLYLHHHEDLKSHNSDNHKIKGN